MIPACSRNLGRCTSKYECVSMARGNCLAVKYRLCQALRAMLMGLQNIMLELMRKRSRLPEKDKGREQPS